MKFRTYDTTRKTKFCFLLEKDQGCFFLYNNELHIFTGSSAYSDFQAVNLTNGNYAMISDQAEIEIVSSGTIIF